MGFLVVSQAIALIVYGIAGGLAGTPPESANWAGLLSPSWLVEGLSVQLFDLSGDSALHAPGALGVAVFALEAVALVAGSYWLLRRRYRGI
jgi:ABC-2 type transport system permease protein